MKRQEIFESNLHKQQCVSTCANLLAFLMSSKLSAENFDDQTLREIDRQTDFAREKEDKLATHWSLKLDFVIKAD